MKEGAHLNVGRQRAEQAMADRYHNNGGIFPAIKYRVGGELFAHMCTSEALIGIANPS